MATREIVLGGGCFWCMEAVFQLINGVISVEPGYAGGHTANPTYEEVCTDLTGHAEVVRIIYDTDKLSLDDIFEIFFASHDPTSLNRQGNDVGTQYRSIILYGDDDQRIASERYVDALKSSGEYRKPIVTEIKKLEVFYPAEEYHRNYFRNNPDQGYCHFVIQPKVNKIIQKFQKNIIINDVK